MFLAGIGGTGIVTVNQVLGSAAVRDGLHRRRSARIPARRLGVRRRFGRKPGCTARRRGNRGSAEARDVKVTPAVEDRLVRAISVTGTLAAEEQVTLSLKVTGRLERAARRPRQPRHQGPGRSPGSCPTDFDLRVSQADAALQQARARLGLVAARATDDAVDVEQTASSARRGRCSTRPS